MKSILWAAILCGFLFVHPAGAESFCGLREEFVSSLRQVYGEALIGSGLTADGKLIELLLSERGSFTILVTEPSGFSCVVAVGGDWDFAQNPAAGSPFSPGILH